MEWGDSHDLSELGLTRGHENYFEREIVVFVELEKMGKL
jgi:hypothetical protein